MANVQFPLGDFYIKSAASPPNKNSIVDVEKGLFSLRGIKEGAKIIIAQQKNNVEHQIWKYENGWIV